MRKGFKSTLMTVAVALLGLKAMAMAPTISKIPDVIIGDEGAVTASNDFVFSGAINIRNYVSDDTTTPGGLKFVFTNSGGHYSINGRTEGSALTDAQKTNPDAAHDLAQGDDTESTDSDKLTFTFRNIHFSPPGGPNTDPGAAGVQDGQVMTIIASDGTTISQPKAFMAFIDNNGLDRLSGGTSVNVLDLPFSDGTTHGWVTENQLVIPAGGVTFTNNANGLCASASAQGINIAGWASQVQYNGANAPHNTVSMVDNAVYQVRVTVSTTAQAGFVPLWYVNFQNTLDWYGGTYIIYDNGVNPNAGANAPAPLGRSVFTEYLNAPAEGTTGYKTALSTPANATFKDFRLRMVILDVGDASSNPYGAAADQGQICWSRVQVDRWDIGAMQVQSTPYNVPSGITLPTNAAAGQQDLIATDIGVLNFSPAGSSTVSYAGGAITITPTSQTAWQSTGNTDTTHDAGFLITPGDGTNAFTGGPDMIDNYPVVWDADQLYRIVTTLQAPDAISESNPIDWFFVGGGVPTNELLTNVYTTNKFVAAAMPKQTAAEYYSFLHGNAGSTAPGNFKRLRWSFLGGTNASFTDVDNKGGVRLTGARIERVAF